MEIKKLVNMLILPLIGVNLLFLTLVIAKQIIPINTEITTIKEIVPQSRNVQYRMEFIGASYAEEVPATTAGRWQVQHFKEFAYIYDERNRFVDKQPTGKEEYLRYWTK